MLVNVLTDLHNKEAIHNSTTFTITFPRVLGVNSKSPSPKSTKKKKKSVSKRSYIIKKLNYIYFTFSKGSGRQFQVSKSPSPKTTKKRKETLAKRLFLKTINKKNTYYLKVRV